MKTNIVNIAKSAMFIMFGVAAIVFALGTVISNPVKADNPATINNTGKIQMSTDGFIWNNNPYYHVMVWDTETGKSKLYVFDKGTTKMISPTYQLPSSPLY